MRNAEIQLNVNGIVVKDQKQVTEILVGHFAAIADGISGNSAQRIKQESENWTQTPDVKPIMQGQVLAVLGSLKS